MRPLDYKLSLDTEIICRTPAFSIYDEIADNLEELKGMIKEASPSFFQIICDLKKEDLINQDDKVAYTLWKYFNRARHRATPFGRFSGISVVPQQKQGLIVLNDNLTLIHFIDWQATSVQLANTVAHFKSSNEYLLNASLYKVGHQYRYIYFDKGRFEIAVIPEFPELRLIVNFCNKKRNKSDLSEELFKAMDLDKASIDQLLTQLISLQVLISDCTPNITGEDFFLRKVYNKVNNHETPYIIAERKVINGGYNNSLNKHLTELVNFLNNHLPESIDSNFLAFIKGFKRKFELRFIPLALALDPELGIGYANLESNQLHNAALTDRIKYRNGAQLPQINYDPFLVFLLNRSMQGPVINLEDFNSEQPCTPKPLPNSFSVILHHFESLGIIEHIGGATANSLIGRFSLGVPAIETMGKRLAAIEQEANADILFFDVAYQAERHIDNVNRRKSFYNYELPILSWSCFDEPLHIDDILVGVLENEIILYSKKYGKRMVPRIPSAYNYHRSDLPLFRFLCDLQHQNIRTKLSFKLKELLPELDHYSRVIYKDLVISPESWRVPGDLVNELINDKKNCNNIIQRWLHQINLEVPFTVGEGDQTLLIFPFNDDDISKLTTYFLKNAGRPIYLSEAFVTDDHMVTTKSGKPLAAQIILNFTHTQRVYSTVDETVRGIKYHSEHTMIPPGNKWLYFAIYSHPGRFNDLLQNPIARFLKTHRKYIEKWFFIRYDDHGPHLRLRILLKKSEHTFILIEGLQQVLNKEIQTGMIADMQIKSYFPEITRYGIDRLSYIEDFFYYDSRYAIQVLKKKIDNDTFYQITLMTIRLLVTSGFPIVTERLDFLNYMALSYSKEFAMGSDDFKLINQQTEQLQRNFTEGKSHFNIVDIQKLASRFAQLLTRASDRNDKYMLAADLIHMHVNRLFISDQREQEAILYQHLFKLLKRQQFLKESKATEALL